MGLLRSVGSLRHLGGAEGAGGGPRQLWLRQASMESRPVAALRCSSADDGCVVSCEVYPVDRFTVEPLRPGPYLFATEREAEEFADEAMLVLEYLGCEVGDSREH